jgi:hypothetical protein
MVLVLCIFSSNLIKCHLGKQMSLLSNVFIGKSRLGKCCMGKRRMGKRRMGKFLWANVVWANVVWANVSGQTSYGQTSYGQMSLGKRCMGKRHRTTKNSKCAMQQPPPSRPGCCQYHLHAPTTSYAYCNSNSASLTHSPYCRHSWQFVGRRRHRHPLQRRRRRRRSKGQRCRRGWILLLLLLTAKLGGKAKQLVWQVCQGRDLPIVKHYS